MNFFGTWFIYTIGLLLYGVVFTNAFVKEFDSLNNANFGRGFVVAIIAAGLMASTSSGTTN